MAPLKSLEREHPILDSNFRSFCASHSIFTVEDFLIHDLSVLASSTDHHPSSHRLREGIDQLLSAINTQHQPWLRGIDLLKDQRNKQVLSTGFHEIDSLLHGGFRQGHLVELVGPSSSGKTQFCFQFASDFAIRNKGTIVYIDSSNSFSAQRIERLVSQRISASSFGRDRDEIRKVMSNILCHQVFDIFTLFDVLHQLVINMKSQRSREEKKVELLVVDSISLLITPILGGSGSQGHAMMTSAGLLLKKLANEHNVVVVVTNHMVGREQGNLKPALGGTWKSIPHVSLFFCRSHGSNFCDVIVRKHPSLAAYSGSKFVIVDT